jgi:ABC-type phosphate/phosphonate transport system substrate-binding protein
MYYKIGHGRFEVQYKSKKEAHMRRIRIIAVALSCILLFSLLIGSAYAETFKIGIMQDKAGAAKKFKPLLMYMKEKGVNAFFVTAVDYSNAAKMFAAGKVDAMFSGSGVAGSMIIKDLAKPIVRPLSKDDTSTYWAVVVAKKGAPKFSSTAGYFAGKKVVFCGLASSGEFFFRSLPGSSEVASTFNKASSHAAAIDVVSRGNADVAIVKNRVWDKEKSKYPNLVQVGEDKGENPNGTLIVAKQTSPEMVKNVTDILLGLKDDMSPKAIAAKDALGIQGYIETTNNDFKHTLALLKRAGVTKGFDFKF